MSIDKYLDIKLEDDDSETGGIEYPGETVRDFIEATDIPVKKWTLQMLNDALVECGICPVGWLQ